MIIIIIIIESWTRFMDHPFGPRPWNPARGPGSWTTPVDHVHGPPLVDPVHGPSRWTWSMDSRSWTRFMDHPGGPGSWTPARGPGSWTTPVDLVHGPPLVDPVHGPPLWTWSMNSRLWPRCMEYFCGPPQMFEDEFCKRCKRISITISGENYVNKLYMLLALWASPMIYTCSNFFLIPYQCNGFWFSLAKDKHWHSNYRNKKINLCKYGTGRGRAELSCMITVKFRK